MYGVVQLEAAFVGRLVATHVGGLTAAAVGDAEHEVALAAGVLVQAEVVRVEYEAVDVAARHQVVNVRRNTKRRERQRRRKHAAQGGARGRRHCNRL